jgi:hypothetical protein
MVDYIAGKNWQECERKTSHYYWNFLEGLKKSVNT